MFGKAGGFAEVESLGSLDGSDGFRLDGFSQSDFSGISVSAAGDVNGDGYTDLIVGASSAAVNGLGSGASYVVFGKSGGFSATVNLGALDGADGFRLDGVTSNDFTGYSVSGAGDVNGDGYDDVIVGAHNADPNGSNSGSTALGAPASVQVRNQTVGRGLRRIGG